MNKIKYKGTKGGCTPVNYQNTNTNLFQGEVGVASPGC